MALSIREQIVQHLKARFEAATHDFLGQTKHWDIVTRKPDVKKGDLEQPTVLAIYDGRETKVDQVGYTVCHLTLFTEFYVRGYMGDDMAEMISRALTSVQETMLSDLYCTEKGVRLSLDIRENRNEVDLQGHADMIAAGVAMWTVVYRHKTAQPTTRI